MRRVGTLKKRRRKAFFSNCHCLTSLSLINFALVCTYLNSLLLGLSFLNHPLGKMTYIYKYYIMVERNINKRILDDNTILKSISLSNSLQRIHNRLMIEGYTVSDGKITPPKKDRSICVKIKQNETR